MRVCVVGYGTVGRWLVEAIGRLPASLPGIRIVAVANARDGLVHRADGLDPARLAVLAAAGRLTDYPGTRHFSSAVEAIGEVDADVLVEVSASPASDGEPGLAHIRAALDLGMGVVTSNKWPVALAGVELSERARRAGVPFRAEATVMSGTPVLGPLTEGLGGAEPVAIRGVLNATVNSILTDMHGGRTYEEALAAAQAAGLAEPDPSADVEGHDSAAKVMILSALVFGRQLRPGDVARRGISELTEDEHAAARAGEAIMREVATLEPAADIASVTPQLLDPAEPLAQISGRMNVVICKADPLGEVTIAGPGAGPELAGQGCLSDLIAIAKPA
jgi:homoserine dehydrogenase